MRRPAVGYVAGSWGYPCERLEPGSWRRGRQTHRAPSRKRSRCNSAKTAARSRPDSARTGVGLGLWAWLCFELGDPSRGTRCRKPKRFVGEDARKAIAGAGTHDAGDPGATCGYGVSTEARFRCMRAHGQGQRGARHASSHGCGRPVAVVTASVRVHAGSRTA